MKKNKKTMEQIMKEEIYPIWDNVSIEKARDELKKMFFRDFNSLKDMEEKRLLLHNLTTAELKSKDRNINSARLYSKTLKDMLDNCPSYTENQQNKQKYVKALNNYIESYKEELSREELINIYEFCYETYKRCDTYNIDGYINKLIAEFNLNLVKKNYEHVLRVIEDAIHNNINTQYNEAIISFKRNVKQVDEALYQKVLLLEQNMKIKIN